MFEAVNFVIYKVSDVVLKNDSLTSLNIVPIRSASVNTLYEEEFGPNKRPHHEFSALASREGRIREKKRFEKKADSQPMIDMFNDVIEVYDKSVFVWQVLKANKINMSFLDFMAWSPKTCWKMKRLATKITKKRTLKFKFDKISKIISGLGF